MATNPNRPTHHPNSFPHTFANRFKACFTEQREPKKENSTGPERAEMSPAAVANQAEQLRKDGNLYFKKERFGAAIDAYTEAIALCPNVAIYLTNRAVCHRKRKEWDKVEYDCRKALQLDHKSVKAHYMLGLALLEKKEYSKGVKELEKALDLGSDANSKSCMGEDICRELANAKYLEWEQESSKRLWKLQTLKDNCEIALCELHLIEASQREDDNLHAEQLETLEWVFKKAVEEDIPTEVPDYLCCKITFDIFRDPVITPSGITYERAVILDHLQKVGEFDPMTREPLKQSQLIPNLAIKEAVRAFLANHSWAYRMD